MITFPGPLAALVTLPVRPDGTGIMRTLAFEDRVLSEVAGVRETVPAFNTLLILGEPDTWQPLELTTRLESLIVAALSGPPRERPARAVELPACYDPDLAPDLAALADRAGLTHQDVARIHSAVEYTVLATGFAPGFAYLGDVDSRLECPRRPAPRALVPAGSIGIADRRTAVYPATGPGGWRLIGRVPESLFADASERLARFAPGARVRFVPITRSRYEAER